MPNDSQRAQRSREELDQRSHGGVGMSPGDNSPVAPLQQMLDQQVARGATVMNSVANSAKRAADEFAADTPQIAELVRGVADRVEQYSRSLEQKSAADLYEDAAEFTRQRPGVVFGTAALVGFLALRAFRSSSTQSASRRRPDNFDEDSHASRTRS